jgi:DNA-binding CsgD family transcriptional regulator
VSDLNHLVRKYTINLNAKIKSICEPLIDCLQIQVFTYYKLDFKGNLRIFSNFPEELDYYFSEKLYAINPYMRHPDLFRKGCVSIYTTPETEFIQKEKDAHKKFKVSNPFLMLEKNHNSMEGFFFATKGSTEDLAHYYLNHFEELKSFNRYFLREANHLLTKMDQEGYNLQTSLEDKFLEQNPSLPLSHSNPKMAKLQRLLSPLSHQERLCLDLFKQGHSAQATATIMGLSRRTVEHYFDTIKLKLNCNSKWDLLNFG